MDSRTLQLLSGLSSSATATYNLNGKRHSAHCYPVPAITATNLCGGSWHRDASAPYCPLLATTAACLSGGSWHRDASAPRCFFPTTTAACFSQGSCHEMPEPPATRLPQSQQLTVAGVPSAAYFQQPQQLASTAAPGTGCQRPKPECRELPFPSSISPSCSCRLGSSAPGCQHPFFPLSNH